MERVSRTEWKGRMGEFLYSIGTSSIRFKLEKTPFALRLWAKGERAFNVPPFVVIRLDDRVIARTMLVGEDFAPLILTPAAGEGEHVVSVEFINDISVPTLGQDRNVYLGDLEILHLRTYSGDTFRTFILGY